MSSPHDNDPSYRIHPNDLTRGLDRLPALPAIVADLLSSIDQEDADLSRLARKIALDQTLAAKTLKLANSSFYGVTGKVATIPQAINLLGIQNVRNLVTAAALSGNFPDNRTTQFNFTAFWRHSLATAVCAKVLARHLRLHQDYAFTAGLLHDIGRLVLVTNFPRHYDAVLAYRSTHDCYLHEAEQAVLGIDHAAAGSALAAHWQFAPTLLHAVNDHHAPDEAGKGSIASLINVADAIAHALDLTGEEDDLVPPVSLAAWHGIGLEADTYMLVFRETELEFEQISSVL